MILKYHSDGIFDVTVFRLRKDENKRKESEEAVEVL